MEYIATICIFIYNHEKYIERTIKSVLNQKTKYKFKIFVIDDHSTDNTRDVIDNIAANCPTNNIFKIYQKKNIGLNNNVEYILQRLDTKYVFILGGDDYWIDEKKIEKQIDLLENNLHISYVHTGYDTFDERTNNIKKGHHFWKWDLPHERKKRVVDAFTEKWTYYPCASTCCIRTNIVQEGLKKYRKLLHSYITGEGTIIHVSICMLGESYAYIPEPTTIYTVRQESLSHFKKKKDFFRFQTNYFKTKIVALHLIGIETKKEYYFFTYSLNNLLQIARSNSIESEFDKLLKELKKEIPRIIVYYFSLCNHSLLAYKINNKIQQHLQIFKKKNTDKKV